MNRSSEMPHQTPAAVVVAHPDDEGLWFSSVLSRVERIVICLVGSARRPELGEARRKGLATYPLPGLTCLGIDQSDCFGGADWRRPVWTEYGIALPNRPDAVARYRANHRILGEGLRPVLEGCTDVFTHSPWGEYGHEDHVQIHRVVRDLQQQLRYRVWYPNYCSGRTRSLARNERVGGNAWRRTLATDRKLAGLLRSHYQAHGCWTWPEDWEGFATETFIGQTVADLQGMVTQKGGGPFNLIRDKAAGDKLGWCDRLYGRRAGSVFSW